MSSLYYLSYQQWFVSFNKSQWIDWKEGKKQEWMIIDYSTYIAKETTLCVQIDWGYFRKIAQLNLTSNYCP